MEMIVRQPRHVGAWLGTAGPAAARLLAGAVGSQYQAQAQAAAMEQAVVNALRGYIGDPAKLAEIMAHLAMGAKVGHDILIIVKNFLMFAKRWSIPALVVYLCLKFPNVAKAVGTPLLNAFWSVLKRQTRQVKRNIESTLAELGELDNIALHAGKYVDSSVKKVCQLIVKLAMFMHNITGPARTRIYKEIGEFASRAKGKIFSRQTAAYIWNDWVKASSKAVLEKLKRAKSAIMRVKRKSPNRQFVQAEKQVNQVISQVERAKTPMTPEETKVLTQFAKSVTPYMTPRENFTPRKSPTPRKLRATSSMRATPGSSPIRRSP